MTIGRLDISPAIIKLSQYVQEPDKCHYQAVKAVFVYLCATANDGIYYWRSAPREELPNVELPRIVASKEQLREYFDMDDPLHTKGAATPPGATAADTGAPLAVPSSYLQAALNIITPASKPPWLNCPLRPNSVL